MNDSIPSATDVRESLAGLTTGQVRAIAEKAGVPFTTLWKIKTGETANPGIETVYNESTLMIIILLLLVLHIRSLQSLALVSIL